MRTYVYQAGLYCERCGEAIRAELTEAGKSPKNPNDETSYDSDSFPKGPYDASESDTPDYCERCRLFLENPLTCDGVRYVREAL